MRFTETTVRVQFVHTSTVFGARGAGAFVSLDVTEIAFPSNWACAAESGYPIHAFALVKTRVRFALIDFNVAIFAGVACGAQAGERGHVVLAGSAISARRTVAFIDVDFTHCTWGELNMDNISLYLSIYVTKVAINVLKLRFFASWTLIQCGHSGNQHL